jgi:hypothetical protein
MTAGHNQIDPLNIGPLGGGGGGGGVWSRSRYIGQKGQLWIAEIIHFCWVQLVQPKQHYNEFWIPTRSAKSLLWIEQLLILGLQPSFHLQICSQWQCLTAPKRIWDFIYLLEDDPTSIPLYSPHVIFCEKFGWILFLCPLHCHSYVLDAYQTDKILP